MRNIIVFVLLLATAVLFSCRSDKGNTNHGVKPAAVAKSDEVKDTSAIEKELSNEDFYLESKRHLRDIISSIVNGNKKKLASLCRYPICRPYPLHDIESREQMEAYFNVMFDKAFRKRMKNITDDDWDNRGWRGYSIGSGELCVYDSLCAVNYSSPKEQRMLRARVKMDLKSINASLRGKGWKPYFCYRDCTDGSVIRIDVKEDYEREYRLAKYDKGSQPSDMPDVLMYGTVSMNGSMHYRYHEFCNEQGDSISFGDIFCDPDDDGTIEMKWENERMTEYHRIKKCYWLDEICLSLKY